MQGDAAEAVAALRTACELNPTRPATLASAANAFVFCGERDTALRMAEESLALDLGAAPMNWAYRVSVYLFTGRFGEAIAAVDRAHDATWLGEGDRVVALASLGETAEARARWTAYVASLSAAWRGRDTPDGAAVAEWYLAAQPVCGDADRRWLRASLAAAGAPVA
jgi:tetratricopeptide (TPR) repeat protein